MKKLHGWHPTGNENARWARPSCSPRMLPTVFLLVTGASGAGKSTVRRLVAPELGGSVQCVELGDVVDVPGGPTVAWRQRATEMVVRRALELQTDDRHLLLSGDPVAAGEVLAAPSADQLDGVAACLLDVDRSAQAARLRSRGDDPVLLVHHVAFADWMRGHARDPSHMPEVLITNGWEKMGWERWADGGMGVRPWAMDVIETSSLTAEQVATEVLGWCRQVLTGQTALLRARDDQRTSIVTRLACRS
jgi:hypothetical protein